MVYENTNIPYTPMTPESPLVRVARETKQAKLSTPTKERPKQSLPLKQSPVEKHHLIKSEYRNSQIGRSQVENYDSQQRNSKIQVIIRQDPTLKEALLSIPLIETPPNEPQKPTNSQSNITIALPQASNIIKKEEYQVFTELSPLPSETHGHKRKIHDVSLNDNLQGPDQREQADAAFRDLQEFLNAVFEAEENPDENSDYYTLLSNDTWGLTGGTHIKLQSLLQKIISLRRLSQVPLDDLLRLEKLCDGAVRVAGHVNIRFEKEWEQSDVDTWLEHLSTGELGLRSARTVLRVMTGGREEKQLYSEEAIQGAINALNNIVDSCIVPIVELRDSGSMSGIFKALSVHRRKVRDLLTQCHRVLALLKDLVALVELSETVINTLEYAVSRLIFVENSHSEKDSVLGVAKFDTLRVVAMDTLAQIFFSRPSQRNGIFNEILTSLEKLPVAKQSARQFKLVDGGSIQLVSALIMRLIQTSANKTEGIANQAGGNLEINGSHQTLDANPGMSSSDTERRAAQQPSAAIHELHEVVQPLLDTARTNASYVVNFIVQRAMGSTKTGDAPYRNLLDLFVQDFVTCLSLPDWPAAELLLRILVSKMVYLAENDKTAAPAKTMALDLLGEMGAAISHLNSQIRKTVRSLENEDTGNELGKQLAQLLETFSEDTFRMEELLDWEGPYFTTLEHLVHRCATDSVLQSAVGYLSVEWAAHVCTDFDADRDPQDLDRVLQNYGRIAYRLRMVINDKHWLDTEYAIQPVKDAHAKLAYGLTLLNSQFCGAFDRVLGILLASMGSEQATVRNKSLKSVNQVLDTDPTILDRHKMVILRIRRCSIDISVQVRDSALGLIGKCIGLRPALEEQFIPDILRGVQDESVGVRKRAIKLLKEIYLRNNNKDTRSSIAAALLDRSVDLDEGVKELARQTIEEVWMSPFYLRDGSTELPVQYRLEVNDHVALMVKTIHSSPMAATMLDKVLKSMLSNKSKNTAANFVVCKTFVATMFDTIISGGSTDRTEARGALELLTTFAKANSKLFTIDQIQLLQPFLADIKTATDLAIFKPAVVIFRHVFPHLSSLHAPFLATVRATLTTTIPVIASNRPVLDDVFACLWVISGVLNSKENLEKVASSTIRGIKSFSKVDLSAPNQANTVSKVKRLFKIVGMCGKYCDLESEVGTIKQKFPDFKGENVSKFMVDTFAPFASPSQPLEVRESALDAIGLVCLKWPKNFNTASVSTAFLQVFQEKSTELEAVVMTSFKEFFMSEEKRSDPDAETVVGGEETIATLGVMGGSQHDGVANFVCAKFMPFITSIALASQDNHALLATEILTSINRQGLTHPKVCAPTFVALETSENPIIAELVFKEHRAIHQKYETILEKEYMRAIQSAFAYQQEVTKNTRGATTEPYRAKLHFLMDVLNTSKVKMRKKFYENLCSRIDFEPSNLDASQDQPEHLAFSRFIIENMAFFEYATVEELLVAISSMEKVVANTGTIIAHLIETEIFKMGLQQFDQPEQKPQENLDENTGGETSSIIITDPARLRQLTVGSMVLSCLWEARTYLRRLYGLMNTEQKKAKGKGAVKDQNKSPVKVQGNNGDKFWEEITKIMTALSSQEAMIQQCKSFVELLTVDKDFKITAETEDDVAARARLDTPSDAEDDNSSAPPTNGRGRKRKAGGGTPGGRKKRARSNSRTRGKKNKRGSVDSDEDGYGS
jgi:cohesin loading factor subunit SCC2